MRNLALTLAAIGLASLCGCDPVRHDRAKGANEAGVAADSSDPGIMPSAAGGAAPVTNPEAVTGAGGGGTGGGLGQAAKDQARRAAAQAGGPSGTLPSDGD